MPINIYRMKLPIENKGVTKGTLNPRQIKLGENFNLVPGKKIPSQFLAKIIQINRKLVGEKMDPI